MQHLVCAIFIFQTRSSVTENGVNSNILELVMNDGNEKAVLCGNDCKGDKYNGKKQYV